MAIAVKSESDAHFLGKSVAEVINNNIYLFPQGLNLTVKTEEKLPGCNYIPDLTFYLDNDIFAVMEIVNQHATTNDKNLYYNNWNIFAMDMIVTKFVDCRKHMPFYLWEADYQKFVEEILLGKRNELLNVISHHNAQRHAILDGKQVTFVHYEVLDVNSVYRTFNVMGYDGQGNSYHLYFSRNNEQQVASMVHRIKLANEPIYFIQSGADKWIDALSCFRRIKTL